MKHTKLQKKYQKLQKKHHKTCMFLKEMLLKVYCCQKGKKFRNYAI